jgi:hypothetical protein
MAPAFTRHSGLATAAGPGPFAGLQMKLSSQDATGPAPPVPVPQQRFRAAGGATVRAPAVVLSGARRCVSWAGGVLVLLHRAAAGAGQDDLGACQKALFGEGICNPHISNGQCQLPDRSSLPQLSGPRTQDRITD